MQDPDPQHHVDPARPVAPDTKMRSEELSAPSSETSLECVDAIIAWGDREIASRIRSSAALYNCGVRVNELCEELFGRRQQMLQDARCALGLRPPGLVGHAATDPREWGIDGIAVPCT